jgi:hypothetical protein
MVISPKSVLKGSLGNIGTQRYHDRQGVVHINSHTTPDQAIANESERIPVFVRINAP